MKLLVATAIVWTGLITAMVITPSLEKQGPPAAVPAGPLRLLSPTDLQKQINAVLIRYQQDTIKEDGKLGPATGRGYAEAYSLQQAENSQRGCYK